MWFCGHGSLIWRSGNDINTYRKFVADDQAHRCLQRRTAQRCHLQLHEDRLDDSDIRKRRRQKRISNVFLVPRGHMSSKRHPPHRGADDATRSVRNPDSEPFGRQVSCRQRHARVSGIYVSTEARDDYRRLRERLGELNILIMRRSLLHISDRDGSSLPGQRISNWEADAEHRIIDTD